VTVCSAFGCGLIEFSSKFHPAVSVNFLAFFEEALVFEYFFVGETALVLFDLEEGRLAILIALLLALLLLLLLQLLLTDLCLLVNFEACL